jgi:hypothetical protein
MVNTIGRCDVKNLIDLFNSIVSSIYRFGLGAWGPTAGKLTVLDDLFTNFIRWLFSLPKTSVKLIFSVASADVVRCVTLSFWLPYK